MSEVWDDFSIDVTISDGDATFIVAGELDLASAPLLERELEQLGDRLDRRVTIDLAGLTFIDSAGLRALVGVRDHLLERNRQFVVGACSPAVRRVVELTGLGELLGNGDSAPT